MGGGGDTNQLLAMAQSPSKIIKAALSFLFVTWGQNKLKNDMFDILWPCTVALAHLLAS